MTVLDRLSHFQNRRDEVPNQALAKSLAAKRDKKGIKVIAENLWNDIPGVQADCLKVLYEIGYLDPTLIDAHVGDFLTLVQSKNNRLVWGAMMALSTVAAAKSDEIAARVDDLKKAIERGSVITVDNGIKTIAIVASKKPAHRKKLFPYLLKHLATCRPQSVAQHAEHVLVAVDKSNAAELARVLEKRLPDLSTAQAVRVKRVLKAAASR